MKLYNLKPELVFPENFPEGLLQSWLEDFNQQEDAELAEMLEALENEFLESLVAEGEGIPTKTAIDNPTLERLERQIEDAKDEWTTDQPQRQREYLERRLEEFEA